MKLRTFIVGGAVLSILVGFSLGKIVMAESPAPGSSSDPVVSKSYVDKAMEERMQELEKKVAELTVQAQALQTTINELQTKVNKGTTVKPSTGTTTPTTPTQPTNNTTTVVGKTAYISPNNTYVNLRSGPAKTTDVIKKVYKSDAMVIQKVENDWYQVKLTDGTLGWIAGWLVVVQ